MKISIKIAVILASITFFSCSSSDSPVAPSTANTLILPKKITEITYFNGSPTSETHEFFYENNVLKSSSIGNKRYEFFYNGNKVDQIKIFSNNVAGRTITFNYSGDNLNYTFSSDGYKTEFFYNGNTVSRILYKTVIGTTETINEMFDLTFDAANNKVQEILTEYYSSTPSAIKITYTFDTKNNPITNFNKYLKLVYNIESISGFSVNNYLTQNYYNPSSSSTPTDQYTCQIVYNSNNYPTRIIRKKVSNNSVTSDTTIEYN